jgi:catechol-2,3-dioxygenase
MPSIRPSKFAHVVYRTRRFKEMLEWYKRVFGARVQHQNPALAFLTYDDEHHRFAIADLDVLAPGGTEKDKDDAIGVDHVGYTYASITDLFENYAELKQEGINPYWCIHHGLTVSMYYADPDGNQMEFQVDAYQSAEECNDYITGDRFSVNPIGVEYDADEWLDRIRAGEPVSNFLVRQSNEPVSPIRGQFAKLAGM